MRRTQAVVLPTVLATVLVAVMGSSAGAAGTWTWPARGPIARGFDPPASPYGAGHRGIDIAVAAGTPVLAPAAGVVSFAGRVAGQLFVSIDHGSGLVSTSSYLSEALVAEDDTVVPGQPVARSGPGHPGSAFEHVHFGVRLGGVYVDPLDYLGPLSLVGILWLAPIEGDVSGLAVVPRGSGPPWATETVVPRRPPAGLRHDPPPSASGEPGVTSPSAVRGRPVPP